MNKILIVSNEFGFTQPVLHLATEIARTDAALLHSIFMQPLHEQDELGYLFPNDYRLTGQSPTGESYKEEDHRLIRSNIEYFKSECTAAGVPYQVDSLEQNSLEDLLAHSAFADLIILDANADVGPYALRDLLADARCPVCLVPSRADLPGEVVLCYDGSPSSIYALKLFSYLFPSWRSRPAVLLSVLPGTSEPLPQAQYLGDWLAQHFPAARIELRRGNPRKELVRFLKERPTAPLVVLGSYGRSSVSRVLQQSVADVLLRETTATLFIAHK